MNILEQERKQLAVAKCHLQTKQMRNLTRSNIEETSGLVCSRFSCGFGGDFLFGVVFFNIYFK